MRRDAIGTLVLYAPSAKADLIAPVFPKERYDEILSCSSVSLRREKLAVWKLLEKAVKEHLNLDFANLCFTKTPNGKWTCPEFHFSLSHSGDIVAVAVSEKPVGVDVQKFCPIKEGLAERILTEEELRALVTLPPERRDEFILSAWAGKESAFKKDGDECLTPRKREGRGASISFFEYGAEKYVLAVTQEDSKENIEIRFTEEI